MNITRLEEFLTTHLVGQHLVRVEYVVKMWSVMSRNLIILILQHIPPVLR